VKLLDAIFASINPPQEFEVSSAADWSTVPLGFFRVQSNGKFSLGFHHEVLGVMRDVQPAFNIGRLSFTLEQKLSELPLVRVRVTISQPGVWRTNGLAVVDTDTYANDGAVEYEAI